MGSKVVIRVDASIKIGIGHVMRCLTLAEALKSNGAEVSFICRAHKGHLIEQIEQKGFFVFRLLLNPSTELLNNGEVTDSNVATTDLTYAAWLGATQQEDAFECQVFLKEYAPRWLIVDHYAIDRIWQSALTKSNQKLMVIDDLANRKHLCDVLLDQTYGRAVQDYQSLVPKACHSLLGAEYALLAPSFSQWRAFSLQHRDAPSFKQLLITMGGVDQSNVTGQILDFLNTLSLPNTLQITVVLGATAPHLTQVQRQAKTMRYQTQVLVSVDNMAEIMANSDFAIGAAGATTWERCSLGLPSMVMMLANNQQQIMKVLSEQKIALVFDKDALPKALSDLVHLSKNQLKQLSLNASNVLDGLGCERVVKILLDLT
ncbi:MAG: UDP-2,4-diacetamido-2,4,6-trideoxy-beta-L-altropyranose hydrolase [Gammaproteobacteria bacterium]|nr:UDP-2,4-diacetamido-2,4,6-trideoxy-beta-L-altropyranose hydrolase [Gammaproteobacteria bacterium]